MDFMKIQIDKFHNTSLGQELEEQIPPVPKSTKTKKGDMYRLGRHVVMCGDATDPTDVNKLLGKAKVQSLVTDPPYGGLVPYIVKYDDALEFIPRQFGQKEIPSYWGR